MGFALGVLAAGIGVIGYWHRKSDARRDLSRRGVPSDVSRVPVTGGSA
jgi:hypothetical protein